ncbi:MAG: DEAD/DEAH box helicase, partial [Candidatus Eremiobacteraeota bacterium]|nr:DEAD/DEAH box helicase [Candidatus Eremiobacteraeota bacterium]
MLEEVAADICASPVFQTTVDRIEQAWLRRQLELDMAAGISTLEVKKLLEAAAILACSSKKQNRQLAYRIATLAFEHCGETELPSDQALRVVLTRLGNFPALNTKPAIESAATRLPLSLFVEEQHAVKSHTLSIGENTLVLTPFQFELWASLAEGSQVAFNAPTSSGKSFVLGQYVCSRFLSSGSLNVVFLVPTRALISQVADDVAQLLGDLKLDDVDVIWLPPSEEAELPSRSVYVFTQERLQLLLGTHTNFNPDLVVVDEAQSISDGSRGVLLQWAIDDILDAGQSTQVLFASPAVSNLEVFQNLFRLPNLRALTTAEPSVSQNFIVAKVTSTKNGEIELASLGDGSAERRFLGKKSLNQVLASKRDRLVHISHHFGAGSVNIVYANGAAEAEKVALQLADMQDESTLFHDSLKDLAELADESVHPKYALSYCIQKGVAFHYGNIPTKLRRAIEVAASSGLIRYLVCTSTLLQ